MSEFAKGSWECQDSEDSDLIHIGPVNDIGIMEFCVTSVHDEDHANLIAAAPDMLEALEAIKKDLLDRASLDSDNMKVVECSDSVWVQLQDAIAKAKAKG